MATYKTKDVIEAPVGQTKFSDSKYSTLRNLVQKKGAVTGGIASALTSNTNNTVLGGGGGLRRGTPQTNTTSARVSLDTHAAQGQKLFGNKVGVNTSTNANANTISANGANNSSSNGSGLAGQLQSLYQQQIAQQQATANGLAAQLKAQQEQYQTQLKAQQEAQAQAAQNAYNSNMSALLQAYNNRKAGLGDNLASTKDLLAASYQNSQNNLNKSAEKALQEAYINRMMNERSLAQQLNAQGLNGGASESAIASMLNNYGTSRNNINNALVGSLGELEQNYNSNLASALQSYNDALGNLEDTNLAYRMQMENDLANNVLGSYQKLYNAFGNLDSNYVNAMTNILSNQANASNDLQSDLYNVLADNALQKYKANIESTNGGIAQDVANKAKQLFESGYTANQLANGILADYSDEQVVQFFVNNGIPFME